MKYTFYYTKQINAKNLDEAITKEKRIEPTLNSIETEEPTKEINEHFGFTEKKDGN